MRAFKHLCLLLTGAAFLAAPAALRAQSETITGAGATLNPLEVMGQGARPLAMGSAFTAVKGDLMAGLFNPAGEAYLRGTHGAAHHNAWIGGINQDSLAAVLAGDALAVGIYGDLINYGAIETTDDLGNANGTFTPMDFTLGLSLAHEFKNGLALGSTLRGTQQNIKESGQLISSGDLGAMWSAKEMPVTLGLAYSNLGPAVAGKATTAAMRFGLSFDIPITGRSGVLIAGGGTGLNNGASQVQLGIEGRLSGILFARAGYQLSFLDNKTGGLTGLTSGLGVKVGSLVLDYAYLPYGIIGNNHRISLSFQFEDAAAPDKPKPVAAKMAPAPRPIAAAPAAAEGAASAASATAKSGAVDMVFEVPVSEEAGLKQATQQHPQDPDAWRKLGRWYYSHSDKAQMIEAYDKAVALDPGDVALKEWLEKVKAGGR